MTSASHPQTAGPTGPATDDVASLVDSAREGNRLAFEQLMRLYQGIVYRMAFVRTQSRMDAEDLTQDVFLQAFRNLGGLKEPERFRPWLMSIAVNRIRDFHRKRRIITFFGLSSSHREDEDPPEETEPSEETGPLGRLLQGEFWRQVRAFADHLSRWEREVFFLRFFDELGNREIASVLGKSESAVKTHLCRAIKKFKDNTGLLAFLDGENP
ncbi:MAG: RNA polymerase sigma factor [Syntrophobacteraceae bacterium]